jgi:hypothetical protein
LAGTGKEEASIYVEDRMESYRESLGGKKKIFAIL